MWEKKWNEYIQQHVNFQLKITIQIDRVVASSFANFLSDDFILGFINCKTKCYTTNKCTHTYTEVVSISVVHDHGFIYVHFNYNFTV